VNKGELENFNSACQLKSRGRIESRKRRVACGQWHWDSLKFREKTGADLGGRGSGRAAERWYAL
jgi:hypothetical protein